MTNSKSKKVEYAKGWKIQKLPLIHVHESMKNCIRGETFGYIVDHENLDDKILVNIEWIVPCQANGSIADNHTMIVRIRMDGDDFYWKELEGWDAEDLKSIINGDEALLKTRLMEKCNPFKRWPKKGGYAFVTAMVSVDKLIRARKNDMKRLFSEEIRKETQKAIRHETKKLRNLFEV